MEVIGSFLTNVVMAFYNLAYAITHPGLWLDWTDKEALSRFVYYGGSSELFYVIFVILLIVTAIGLWRHSFLWKVTIGLEAVSNTVGRIAAWAGLLMVLQQIIIVLLQRVFTAADISIGFGKVFTFDVSWWAEELKLYNAIVVCLCCAYTFVQGSHVRVDLFYAGAKWRTKKIVDMFGAVFFMMPLAILTWIYGWYFMWRHLIVPKPSASDALDRMLMKSRALRWNVETIGFSPNGFNAYFLFKVLLCLFCLMVFLQAIATLYRSYLELREGPKSKDKYLDKDSLGEGEEAYEGTH
ncbi:TRAP transporter small permease subunit [Sulfitobacter aestuariivivens]|uniref:C4-dicarboxylate ABC transporter permease n=1 Tax=Sulfitobacter aestuariivivens TaxID=2766981 RepID=A0A927D461_9RHOB|nr:TRAP transporter small permease subunit [Sulfitobacter aestuariivivens]MBD3663062.1 C4-dicarboxylate ABC transporter permease [Sulfitobacter aestuariivivens]